MRRRETASKCPIGSSNNQRVKCPLIEDSLYPEKVDNR